MRAAGAGASGSAGAAAGEPHSKVVPGFPGG